jgi:two-component system, OmpR family, phosphate regulon response regulator PhoB
MLVLICVADAQLYLLLRHILANDGFEAILVTEYDELQQLISLEPVAAMIVDWVKPAPGFDTFVMAAQTRFPAAAVVCLHRRPAGEEALVNACDLRLESPFNPVLLLSFLNRVRHRLESEKEENAGHILRFADLCMDVAAVKVRRGGRDVALTALQFRLLRRLLQDPSMVCERDDLIEACWPESAEVEPRTVDIHIGHIRRALMGCGPDLIRTVRGRGYALEMPS